MWNGWIPGECSVTCGVGTLTKTRTKSVDEKNGGHCVGVASMREPCHNNQCPSKNIKLGW